MADYTIIGGDQKQYGSVTADDICRWVAEGRLNAQSLVQTHGDSEWKPLSAFPEFADALAGESATPGAPPSVATPVDWQERDYELDIGGCISRGWELLKNNFGLLFTGVLIYLLIEGAIGGLGSIPLIGPLFSIANLFIAGPLIGGVFYIFIQAIRGQPTDVGDVFAGFRKAFIQLFLGTLVPGLLIGLCMVPFIIVFAVKFFPAIAHVQHTGLNNAQVLAAIKSTLSISLPVLLICLIPVTYLAVSWKFTLPLIIDRQMDFWSAMEASRKMVSKHWWQVFGLVILVGLVNVAGLLLCCVGILLTLPIGFGALMYAYETIFSQPQAG
jgi:uncharacterized membrane protein